MEKWKGYLYRSIVLMLIGFSFPIAGIMIAVILNQELTFDYIFRYLFALGPFVFFGIRDIMYALKHKHNKYYFPHGILFITRKNIEDLKKEGVIKGYGLEDHPYYIHFTEDVKLSRIQMKDLNCYLKIENMNVRVLLIQNCENITINSNNITRLRLILCYDIRITNNTIQELRLGNSHATIVENNDISYTV